MHYLLEFFRVRVSWPEKCGSHAQRHCVRIARRPALNEEYLARAKGKVEDVRLLINGAAKRAAELARGAKPLVPTLPDDDRSSLDIALLEIAEGAVVIKAVVA